MSTRPKSATRKSAVTALAKTVAKLEATATVTDNAVKVTPGHGVAGRHPTRKLLDALSGNKDPGMFGRMFPCCRRLRSATPSCRRLPTR